MNHIELLAGALEYMENHLDEEISHKANFSFLLSSLRCMIKKMI